MHCSDLLISAMASQITGVSIVYSAGCLGAHQRKYQSSASLAFLRGIHRRPLNSRRKGPVKRKMFPFDDVIMELLKKHSRIICEVGRFRLMWCHAKYLSVYVHERLYFLLGRNFIVLDDLFEICGWWNTRELFYMLHGDLAMSYN